MVTVSMRFLNYNVPEASYASNPSDSKTVIKECKEMIQALHSAGFSVVMEMPYTHASEENPLEKSVPWFYYRLNTDGTRYTTNTDMTMSLPQSGRCIVIIWLIP